MFWHFSSKVTALQFKKLLKCLRNDFMFGSVNSSLEMTKQITQSACKHHVESKYFSLQDMEVINFFILFEGKVLQKSVWSESFQIGFDTQF